MQCGAGEQLNSMQTTCHVQSSMSWPFAGHVDGHIRIIHGQSNLAGYSPWSHKSDTTEVTEQAHTEA